MVRGASPHDPAYRPPARRWYLALVCVAAWACMMPADAGGAGLSPQQQQAIDSAVTGFMKQHAVPGCSLSLGRGSALVHAAGYGLAGPKSKATTDTVYRIGSLTKQFTAALALAAVPRQDGRTLHLDTPLTVHFPDQKQWAGITLRQLLNHTSGLPSYTEREEFRSHQLEPVSREALLDLLKSYAPAFKPGSRGHYSNTNYLLFAHILEQATGRSYADLLQTTIFTPLGMDNSGMISLDAPGPGVARGSVKGQFVTGRTHPNWAFGVGDLQSTVLDIAKWNIALIGNRLLSESDRAEMFSAGAANSEPAVRGERLAMGWMDISAGGVPQFYHQGYLYGFSAINYLADPFGSGGRFVTILCNAHLVQEMPQLARRIGRLL